MKIGLIGCGGMGTTHDLSLKALSETHGIEVVALADCRPEKLTQAAALWPQARCYQYGEELLEHETLDMVDICLPSYEHARHAIATLQKGMHVFVEKPVCLTEEDCQKLLDAEKSSGRKVMVGQVLRSAPEYRFLYDACKENTYGALKSIVMQRVGSDVPWGYEDWFHDEAKSGSVVLDLHVHDLDFLRWTLGEPDSFTCRATAFESGMVNQIITCYQFGPVFATAEGTWNVSPKMPFQAAYRACFAKATVVWDNLAAHKLAVYHADGSIEYPELVSEYSVESSAAGINITNLGPYYAELKYFIECLTNDRPVQRAPLCDAVGSVRQAIKEWEAAKAYISQHNI